MTTRRASNSARVLACCALVLLSVAWVRGAMAQVSADETALRERYHVSQWPTGNVRTGFVVSRAVIPGLALRARTDRAAVDGGISLSFGASATTVRVRVAVGANASEGREALVGFVRGAQSDLVPLVDRQGADVAFGDSARGEETVVALFGNVSVSIERTRDASHETPPAWRILSDLRAALGPEGPPSTPSLSLDARGTHVLLRGGPFEHVEAAVRGGHLHGAPSPNGVDVVADRPGTIEVRVIATDALGRTASATTVLAAGQAAPGG